MIELLYLSGADVQALALSADEIGCFSVQPIPPGPFRLRCRTAPGIDAVTGWITL